MILKFNKDFNNAYENKRKVVKGSCIEDNYWQNICDEYFQLVPVKDNNLDSILDKFKTICCFDFMGNYCVTGEYSFNDDFNYLVNCIKKDIKKYIISDKIKFTEIFYHPLNNCIIYNIQEINSSKIDTNYHFQSDKVDCAYLSIKYKDIKNDVMLTDCANIFFKYNLNGKDNVLLVCFLRSHDNYNKKIMPKFKKIKIEEFEKYKNKITKFLQTHKELENISNLVEFQFGE